MDKAQALNTFWNSFGLPAYDSQTVPPDVTLPYITYETKTDSLDNSLMLTNSIWYRSTLWRDIEQKSEDVAERLGLGGEVVKIDDGYLWLTKGSPFAQRMSDPDDSIRRIVINVRAEFLTAY